MNNYFKKLNDWFDTQKSIDGEDLLEAKPYHNILTKLSDYCGYTGSSINDVLTDESISFLKDYDYFSEDVGAKLKKDSHSEKSLVATYKFDPYFNLSNYPMPFDPIRIDVIRQEKSLDDFPELKKDLKLSGFNAKKIVDIEFFEQMHDSAYPDFWNRVLNHYTDSSIGHKELKEKFKDLGVHIEKEKIHLQYAVDDNNNFIPVYIGVGTNQPYGLAIKGSAGKNRFYRLDLMTNSIEQKVCFSETPINNATTSFDGERFEVLESFKIDRTRDVGLFFFINKEYHISDLNSKPFVNNLVKYALGSTNGLAYPDFPLAEVSCNFPINKLDRVKKLKDLQINWTNSDLLSLIDVHKRTILINKVFPAYEEYFSTFYHPASLINEFGGEKIITHLWENAKGIRSRQDFLGMIGNAVNGNLEFVIDDLELMGSTSPRLKVASILLGIMIKTKKLEDLIIKNTSKNLFSS